MKVIKYDTPTHPNMSGWCIEGIAVEQENGVYLDNFWSGGSESRRLNPDQIASAEVLFDTDDFEELDRNRGNQEPVWLTYREEDRRKITHQQGRTASWWIRKGAQPDLVTQIQNKRAEIRRAEETLRSAGNRLASLGEDLGRLFEQREAADRHSQVVGSGD